MKRQWDYSYIVTQKGIERAAEDVGFIFTAYNLRRIFNILTQNDLKKYLKALALNFLPTKNYLKLFCPLIMLENYFFSTSDNFKQIA